MAETSIPETPQVYSLLPPSDSYLKSLDKLWFQCVNGSQRLATPEGKWRDGVVYLTFGCPGDVDRKLPLYSGSSWSIFCDCKGSADWMRQFSMCIPIQPVMLCPRNSLFSALIQTSISEATECAVGPEKVCGISCSGLGCNASVRSLAIRVESILHLSNLLEELIFFNCVLRYLYSTTLSVDVLIKLATSPPDKSVLFDESIDQVELSHGVAAIKNTKFDIEQFVDVIFIMYGIADQLNIIELQLHIDCIISTLLRVHTALKILVCASQYRRNQLILSSLRFIGGNFESIYANSKVLVYDRSTNVAKKGMLYNFLKAVEIKSPDMLDNASICIDVLPIPDNTCPHSSLLTPSVDWWCKMLTDICQLYEPSADLLAEVATSFGDISELNASITTENKEAHSEINLTMSASADIHSLYGDDSSISTNEENDEINDNEDIHDAINTISARNEEVLPFNVAVRTSHEYHRVAGVSLSAEDAIGGNSSKISDYALSIQIPFIFGHSSVLIFNEIVLHFGGRNNYTMFGNDMLLTYFPAKRKWKYVQTFGNMPPMLNTTLALPLQHSNTRHVLHIDDKYGKWSFSILDCHSMMWSSVHVDKSRVGSLFHRHRASISAVSTNESVGFGESTAVNHNQWSHLVVWGGYCFNTQRSKNDVWVVSFSARGGASISTRSSASSATGFTSSPSEEEDMRASLELDESVTDYQIADQDIMPLSGLKSTSSNIKLPQIGRLTDAMIAPEAVVVTSFQPLLTGRPPPTRWGSSSAVINIPDGIRMLVHGGVGQLEGMMEDEVYSLRCGNPTSMHWETVRVTGLGPGTRCGHTMTTSQSGRCILFYGGCVMSTSMWQFREAENDSIFCLEYVCSDYNSIDFTWSALRLSGITISPSLRMKHSAVMWHNAGTQQVKNNRINLEYLSNSIIDS